MTVGDSTQAHMQIKWFEPPRRNFIFQQWAQHRTQAIQRRRTINAQTIRIAGTPEPCWIVTGSSVAHSCRTITYVYSKEASLVVELVSLTHVSGKPTHKNKALNDGVPPKVSDPAALLGNAHPLFALDFSPYQSPTRWAVFNVSFRTPAGFDIEYHRLNLGDMALRLIDKSAQRLLLRQVYPSEAALARRPLIGWLDDRPFKEHKRFKLTQPPSPLTLDETTRCGLIRSGRKRLPFPLGFIGPRQSISGIIHDTHLKRLLIAEYDASDRADHATLLEAIENMNWHRSAEGTR